MQHFEKTTTKKSSGDIVKGTIPTKFGINLLDGF